ncbi:hypothetical protein SD457_07390 [Coprobacillaceae bacterium CR2/5/TPMF4]|nr:hypothetical protein SD457_07390 [Coprobacillaceae bacterium CR2/5/TPMF4]
MKTMYQQFPISKNYSSEEINNVIERDLFEYAKLKPDAIKRKVLKNYYISLIKEK